MLHFECFKYVINWIFKVHNKYGISILDINLGGIIMVFGMQLMLNCLMYGQKDTTEPNICFIGCT